MRKLLSLLMITITIAAISKEALAASLYEPNRLIDEADYYSDEDAMELQESSDGCKCRNGGTCVLNDDFCVCKPKFSGRYCEIDLEQDLTQTCGKLLHGESEFVECAKCFCSNQILTCIAISNSICDNLIVENSNHKRKRLIELKNGSLSFLIKAVNTIEAISYNFYIQEYQNRLGYSVIFKNMESDKDMNSPILNEDNQLIVFNTDQRIVALYFPSKSQDIANSSSCLHHLKFEFVFFILMKIFLKFEI